MELLLLLSASILPRALMRQAGDCSGERSVSCFPRRSYPSGMNPFALITQLVEDFCLSCQERKIRHLGKVFLTHGNVSLRDSFVLLSEFCSSISSSIFFCSP